jgi:hypothetical protein
MTLELASRRRWIDGERAQLFIRQSTTGRAFHLRRVIVQSISVDDHSDPSGDNAGMVDSHHGSASLAVEKKSTFVRAGFFR